MAEKNYVQGLYFNPKSEKQPEFVIGKLSIKREPFREWLNKQTFNEKGYLNLDILKGKDDKPYIVVNDWKPGEKVDPNTPF